jgi:hypothetical protein
VAAGIVSFKQVVSKFAVFCVVLEIGTCSRLRKPTHQGDHFEELKRTTVDEKLMNERSVGRCVYES